MKSSSVSVVWVGSSSHSSLVASLRRPTREKSYFCSLKNRLLRSVRELSTVGWSPGRCRR